MSRCSDYTRLGEFPPFKTPSDKSTACGANVPFTPRLIPLAAAAAPGCGGGTWAWPEAPGIGCDEWQRSQPLLCPGWDLFFLPLPHISSSFLALSLALSSCCVSAATKIAKEVLK